MLIDSPTVAPTTSVTSMEIPSGQTFPTSPSAGTIFYLTVGDGAFSPGVFVFMGGRWVSLMSEVSPPPPKVDDRVCQADLDEKVGTDGGSTMRATLQLGGHRIVGVASPECATDAVNKAYVDTLAMGLKWEQPVRVAVFHDIITFGLQQIDGILTAPGDRVLVGGINGGIFEITPAEWHKASDTLQSAAVYVREGDLYGRKTFAQVNGGQDVFEWAPLSSNMTAGVGLSFDAGVINVEAGSGLKIDGNAVAVNIGNGLSIDSGKVTLKKTGVSPATYGSSTQIPVVTVSDTGVVTGITTAQTSFQGKHTALDGLIAASGLLSRVGDTVVSRHLVVSGEGLGVSNADGVNGNPTLWLNATDKNVAGALVSRDAAGNFTAGTITATLNGGANLNVLKTGDTLTGDLVLRGGDVFVSSSASGEPVTGALDKLRNITCAVVDGRVTLDAADVAEIFPGAVKIHNGQPAVSYTSIIALLIQAVKDLQAEVDALKKAQ